MTTPFENYVALARPKSQLWRLVTGLILILVGYFAATLFGILVIADFDLNQWPTAEEMTGSPFALSVFLFTFFGATLSAMLITKFLHKRPARSLFGPSLSPNIRHFGLAILIIVALSLIGSLLLPIDRFIFPDEPVMPIQKLSFQVWAVWLPIGLIGVLIQTSAEEIVFRGYIQQQLGARFQSFWVWGVIPSVLFGLLHYDTATFGSNAIVVVIVISIIGMIAAAVTARTGNLGAAIGLHFANNVMAILVASPPGDLDALALYNLPYQDLSSPYVAYAISAGTAVQIAGFLIWRRYHIAKSAPVAIDAPDA